MKNKWRMMCASASLLATILINPVHACGISDVPSASSASIAMNVVESLVTIVLETANTLVAPVLSFVLQPLMTTTALTIEDPTFPISVKQGVEQIRAQALLGEYSSCGSCTKATADLQDLLR